MSTYTNPSNAVSSGGDNIAGNVDTGNLHQILAISTSLTQEERRTDLGPVDEDRKKFFFEAVQCVRGMQGCYQDDIEVIKRSLEILKNCPTDDEQCSIAMQNIMNLVDHIDVASDFMKLSGHTIIGEFLRSKNNDLVRMASEIIGISVQNHPSCQLALIEDNTIFPDLFTILESSQFQDNAKTKAVFAISSSIQNNKAGHDKFVKYNGYDVFIQILKTAGIPLRLRICFVVDCLCSQFPQIKTTLLEKGYVSGLCDLLTSIPLEDSKETVLSSLMTIVEGCYDAIAECNKEEHNLKPTLDYLIAHYNDDNEEEKAIAIKLRNELDRFAEK